MNAQRISIVGAAAALLVGVAPAAAQQPDIAGEWLLVDDARRSVAERGDGGFRVGDMGSGWGSPLTLAVESGRVIVAFDPYSAYDLQPPVRFNYPLDGSEARNHENLGFTATRFTSRAAWRGDALLTTDHVPVPPEVAGPGVTAEVRRTIRLAGADTLVIETTRVGVAGAPTVTSKVSYTRSR